MMRSDSDDLLHVRMIVDLDIIMIVERPLGHREKRSRRWRNVRVVSGLALLGAFATVLQFNTAVLEVELLRLNFRCDQDTNLVIQRGDECSHKTSSWWSSFVAVEVNEDEATPASSRANHPAHVVQTISNSRFHNSCQFEYPRIVSANFLRPYQPSRDVGCPTNATPEVAVVLPGRQL